MWAYVGSKALATITREWGVELAAAPGCEVDPGLLQFKRRPPELKAKSTEGQLISAHPDDNPEGKKSMNSRAILDDAFGDRRPKVEDLEADMENGVDVEKASATFVQALMGAVYLHGGRSVTKQFYREHFMSRQLNVADLFNFRHPTRDVNRLCAREGFRAPVARIISETGRKSRHPVFIVGVYSGNDKLGEGAGSSLDEARTRAAVAALKSWYLYSPPDFRLPSEMEENGAPTWQPAMVDAGDVIG